MYISEPQKNIPVRGEYDVLVAGGGIAGVSAALAAARQGVKTLLVEKQCILGGLATAGLVTIYLPLCDGMGKQVSFGIAEELLRLSMVYGPEARYPKPWIEGGTKEEKAHTRYMVQFNPHLYALEMEKLLLDTGVTILYDTTICNVLTNQDKVEYVILENKSGRGSYKVKSVVDATGDADLCKFAGEDTVNCSYNNKLSSWYYGLAEGKLNLFAFDIDNIDGCPTKDIYTGLDGEQNSHMVQEAHRLMRTHYQKTVKDQPDFVPVTLPTMLQIRMTRRVDGAYCLSDTEMHRYFEDSIGMICDWRKRGPVYEIPFRTLYGKKIKNLICAGRCISVTDDMWEISRVIPPCAVTGEAAGIAAAMTDDFASLDVAKLQQILRKNNVVIHENDLRED